MKKMKSKAWKISSLMLTVAMCMFLVTACGSDKNTEEDSTGMTSETNHMSGAYRSDDSNQHKDSDAYDTKDNVIDDAKDAGKNMADGVEHAGKDIADGVGDAVGDLTEDQDKNHEKNENVNDITAGRS